MGTILIPGLLVALAVYFVTKKGGGTPPGSAPPGAGWTGPITGQFTAPSGRVYSTWIWQRSDQMYTVAQLAGSTAYVSFTRGQSGGAIPGVTNVRTDPALLAQMRTDFGM